MPEKIESPAPQNRLVADAARHAVERLMSTADLADVLHVQAPTIRRMRWDGSGPRFIRRGKRCWYDPADVREWIEKQKRTSTSDPGRAA